MSCAPTLTPPRDRFHRSQGTAGYPGGYCRSIFLEVDKDVAGDFPIDAESEKGEFVGNLTRGVVQNQLAGKGYNMRVLPQVDQTLGKDSWRDLEPGVLCERLGVDGLVYPEILTANHGQRRGLRPF